LTKETQPLESPYQRKFVVLDEFNKSLLHQAFIGEMHDSEMHAVDYSD
jgi:hypothetical protein